MTFNPKQLSLFLDVVLDVHLRVAGDLDVDGLVRVDADAPLDLGAHVLAHQVVVDEGDKPAAVREEVLDLLADLVQRPHVRMERAHGHDRQG